ncbi:MAG: type II toxin-antitoxin system RelE/ParE family toxin [Actinomycetota bacterium]|nr:type II toxin-antitoxin system RelE/ParE family toxin [Actinomycetota bacterium]
MSFRVVVTRTAARELAEHLPEAVAAACVELLFGPLADNAHRAGAALRPTLAGQWRARRGEYRIRYRIGDAERVVYVLDIDHRRDAYGS